MSSTNSGPVRSRSAYSYAHPWDELSDEQKTCRCDVVLTRSERFLYNAPKDAYRTRDAEPDSPDFAPATAVEERRKALDDCPVESLDLSADLCELCFGAGWYEDPEDGIVPVVCADCGGSQVSVKDNV